MDFKPLANSSVNVKQVGGSHYQQLDPAPWDVVLAWKLGYLEGTALKYIARWRDKNGIEDIRKAIHFLEKLVEVETSNAKSKEVLRTDYFRNQLRGVGWDCDNTVSGSSDSSANLRGSTVANHPPRTTGYAHLSEEQASALRELAKQSHFGDYGQLLVPQPNDSVERFRHLCSMDGQDGDSNPFHSPELDPSGFIALHMRE